MLRGTTRAALLVTPAALEDSATMAYPRASRGKAREALTVPDAAHIHSAVTR